MMERILIWVFSGSLALGALAVIAWILVTGQLVRQGLDALFLVVVCMLYAVSFGLRLLRSFRRGDFKELLKQRDKKGA